jgi:hypothetical protein
MNAILEQSMYTSAENATENHRLAQLPTRAYQTARLLVSDHYRVRAADREDQFILYVRKIAMQGCRPGLAGAGLPRL